jgi:hypothetical protein
MQPGLSGPAGRPFTEHVNACRFTFGMAQPQHQRDLYVCMSLQARHGGPAKSGKLKALRDEGGVVAIKALYADVDLWKPTDGPDSKKYRTTDEAGTAFSKWLDKTGMPLPTFIVSSGSGGFHAHWVFDQPVTLDVWEPLARALVNAGQTEGFVFDYKITTNPVCILRIPETYNHKTTPPHPVVLAHPDLAGSATPVEYPVALLDKVLTPYKVSIRPGVTRQIPSNLGRISPVFAGALPTGRLDDGVDTYQPELEDVIDGGCQWLDALKQTGGAGRGENEWFESLKVAYYLKDGLQVAHELSEGHATYAEQDTDNKFANIEHSHAGGKFGWPQCRSIHDAGAGECRSCDHFKKGRSPLNFAIPKAVVAVAAAAAIVVSPTPSMSMPTGPEWLPPGYKHDPGRRIFITRPDPKSDDPNKMIKTTIYPRPIFNVQVFDEDKITGKEPRIEFDVALPSSPVKKVRLNFSEFVDRRELARRLASQGMPTRPSETQEMGEFVTAFTQLLDSAKQRVKFPTEPYGWSVADGAEEAWCYARVRYNCNGNVPMRSPDATIDKQYFPTGDMAVWKKASGLITSLNRPELNTILASAAAAPLMTFTGYPAVILHPWGESGSQKTAAMKVAQGAWASAAQIPSLSETDNRIDQWLGLLKNLPYYFDELMSGNRDIVKLAMGITAGRSKGRLKRTAEIAETLTWNTIMTCASNSSIHNYMMEHQKTTVAGINRVFEFEIEKLDLRTISRVTRTDAQATLGALAYNYGHAGLILSEYYGKNIEPLRERVLAVSRAVDDAVQGGDYDRYWIALAAAEIVGAQLGVNLGLWEMDVDRLCGFLVERLKELQLKRIGAPSDLTRPENVERYLNNYLNANRSQTLTTDKVWTGLGRIPSTFRATEIGANLMQGKPITVRAARDDQLVRISLRDFGSWLKREYDVNRSEITAAIQRRLPAASFGKAALASSTRYAGAPREDVIEIDLTRMPPDWFPFN